ncbi:protein muscleblind isoform X5 [Cimex lectularius]|uniref:C3H1-type domain-containing protein n=1 Tax=Cimex lectularius TaxID=79782 RepID=A0A8I6RQG7_CIMLE|nr:protein muscleblind isoform X5 [Cimex lectularius]
MAMVNMNNLLNGKDSRWLQLEVCREFQRNKCSRPDTECKFAHPPANVEVQNGRVTACYDSIKGRCNRDKPPCKYFHPPQHLKDQLLINGRNHLALKNALIQQMGLTPGQPIVPGQVPTAVCALQAATTPYLAGVPQVGSTFSPYFSPGPIMPLTVAPDPTAPLSVVQQTAVVTQQKLPRTDRLEGFPNMVPYKRTAGDKSGVPVYQPASATYQQLLQPFVPVSCEYRPSPATTAAAFTGVALNKMISHHQYLTAAPSHSTSHFSLVRPPPIPPTPLISDIIAAQYSSSLNNNNDDELQPYKKMKTT